MSDDYSEFTTQARKVFSNIETHASLGRWDTADTHAKELEVVIKDLRTALRAQRDKLTAIRYAQKGIKAEVHTDHAGRTWVETP